MQEGGRKMKKLIMTTVNAAYIALCAAVWPQAETVEKTPDPTPAVSAQKATVTELQTEVETAPLAGKRLRFRSGNPTRNSFLKQSPPPSKHLRLQNLH